MEVNKLIEDLQEANDKIRSLEIKLQKADFIKNQLELDIKKLWKIIKENERNNSCLV